MRMHNHRNEQEVLKPIDSVVPHEIKTYGIYSLSTHYTQFVKKMNALAAFLSNAHRRCRRSLLALTEKPAPYFGHLRILSWGRQAR